MEAWARSVKTWNQSGRISDMMLNEKKKKTNSKLKEQCCTKYLSKCLKTWKIDVYTLLQEW